MALKMALAGMCTALCIEGMLQRGLAVPVVAEDTETENYVGSSEWDEFIDYWHSSMNVAVDDLTGGAFDADDVARLNTASYAYASMLYQQYAQSLRADPNTGVIDYSVDIPAGSIETGWYYRGGQPHSAISFGYGNNNDPVVLHGGSVVLLSANDFSVSANITPNVNVAFPSIVTSNAYFAHSLSCTGCEITTLSCSGIIVNDSSNYNSTSVWYRTPFNDRVVTLDNASYNLSAFANSGSLGILIPYAGCLKDSSNQPISSSRQAFVRASVGNNFPDFLLDLKQQLDDNFPEEVVDELWYDPTQGEPLPDTGTLDSLTFPPGLPSVQFNDVELPSEPLPQQAIQGVGFWFSIFTDMLDALGVKYIVITFLVIALVLAILRI